MFAQMAGASHFADMAEKAKELTEVSLIESNEEIAEAIEDFKLSYEIKPKECYNNSCVLTLLNPDFEYVVGYYLNTQGLPIPLGHAWNYHVPSGTYIDMTREAFLSSEFQYASMLRIEAPELSELLNALDQIPPSHEDLMMIGYLND